MALFSRKSKSKRSSKEADSRDVLESESRPTSSHQQRRLVKIQSQSASRSNSMTRESNYDMTAHPAYAQNNIIPGTVSSEQQSYLPVPPIPTELQKDKPSAIKAGRVLGIESKSIPTSAPGSPSLRPHGGVSEEKGTFSRHDSVNSNVDQAPSGPLTLAAQEPLTLAEELAIESAYYNATGGRGGDNVRRSMSSKGHERHISEASYRSRRHTMHQPPARESLSRHNSIGQARDMPRGRSHQSVPSYSMPTNASRPYVQAETQFFDHPHHAHQPSDATISTLPYQSRSFGAFSMSQDQLSSPAMMRHGYHDDNSSIRSYTAPPPMIRMPSRQPTLPSTPLSILDGFKINRRGKILDEEGDAIGELVEGDILDCVRQKCNAIGEVVDEYGRVVGRVRTLVRGLGAPSPAATSRGTPGTIEHGGDYFNLQPAHGSPMMAPVDSQLLQRRADDGQKYRMLIDVPPVPSMPVAYQGSVMNSPALTAKRHTLATYDCVELPVDADSDDETVDEIPVFDLSEPFMPPPTPTVASKPSSPEPVEAPASAPATLPTVVVAKASPRMPLVSQVSKRSSSTISDSTSEASTPSVRSSASSEPSSEHTSSSSISSIQSEDQYEDAVASPVRQTFAKPQPIINRSKPIPRPIHVPMHPRVIVPVSQLTQQQAPRGEECDASSRPTTAVLAAKQEPARPFLESRAKTAPSLATSSSGIASPPLTRPEAAIESSSSAPTSGYASAEESLSEGESVESVPPRKEVRISNLPPTTIPNRGLNRSMSDGGGLSRFNTLTSVPESAPLPDTPRKSALLSPTDASVPRPAPFGRGLGGGIGAKAAPLPAFPRGNFTNSLPQSPFAAANKANNNGAGLPKRNSMPNRPGMPMAPRNAAAPRSNRYTINAPLVPSPLGDHRKAMSTSASSISSQSSRSVDKDRSDAISIISSMSTGRSRTYFTHGGRVTVDAGDLPPSLQKKADVEVTEVPVPAITPEAKAEGELKKRRFSMKIGRKKN